jgi:hypothetical protein
MGTVRLFWILENPFKDLVTWRNLEDPSEDLLILKDPGETFLLKKKNNWGSYFFKNSWENCLEGYILENYTRALSINLERFFKSGRILENPSWGIVFQASKKDPGGSFFRYFVMKDPRGSYLYYSYLSSGRIVEDPSWSIFLFIKWRRILKDPSESGIEEDPRGSFLPYVYNACHEGFKRIPWDPLTIGRRRFFQSIMYSSFSCRRQNSPW